MLRMLLVFASIVFVVPTTLHGQTRRREWSRTTQPTPIPLPNTPDWLKDYKFKQDKFTFVRIKYNTTAAPNLNGRRGWGRTAWATDYPDADLALCCQLEQLTNLKAEPIALELTDERLPNHPFLFLCEPGRLELTDAEVAALRKYLDDGGFLMADDFWGRDEYTSFSQQLKRVFPEREPVELPLEHKIFHCVFDLKEKPQVPAIAYALEGREQGITWESGHPGGDTITPHYKAILDDEDRIMVLMCHNTDLSDGWERAGDDVWYADEFSAKKALPMGINVIFYALTRP